MSKAWLSGGLLLAALAIFGCSTGELSHRQALKLIEENAAVMRKGDPDSSELRATMKGKIGEAVRIIGHQYCGDKNYHPGELLEDGALIASGVVLAREMEPCGNWMLSLNPDFKSYVVLPPSLTDLAPIHAQSVELKLGDFHDAMVTGVTQIGNKACIVYQISWTPTDLGAKLLNDKLTGMSGFGRDRDSNHLLSTAARSATRFDDGWRLEAKGVGSGCSS
ncbi:MAG TPA: hypothetical protein VE218_12060 [Acidobacteriaceae bacterium]|nr:hypothetical protein [Acidobacteriaceae bacterium]